jgi:fluoride ion exporter CrcB/FEX
MSLATIRKALVTLVGTALMVLTTVAHLAGGFLPASWLAIVTGLIAALTTVSTWLAPNDTGIEARPVVSKRPVAGPE